ncbi:ComEC/Rec2 family competence protein [Piscinibacter sakaiensis]|uniref:ComEC/Rec2 family competence protein n=1 Tax=Piscinibacter sakaiensis TaxID=1547922 RepID=UPI003AB0F364
MFKLSVLPASYGDCLWIEYGQEDAPRVILIDAGPSVPESLIRRLEKLRDRGGRIELMVVTHVDADHIAGALKLLKKDFYGVEVADLWFNGFRHLPGIQAFGEKQGEQLTELIVEKGYPWNKRFGNGSIMVNDEEGQYPSVELEGGARITLLSPDPEQLTKLKKRWIDVCGEAGLYRDIIPVPEAEQVQGQEAFGDVVLIDVDELASTSFSEDNAVANGSSIAFELSFEGRSILCAADAFPSRLMKSLHALRPGQSFTFDAVKLPHHGSQNNVSAEFVSAIDCPRFIFSSNGAKFKHPSKPAVARVIQQGQNPELIFNYRSEFNEMWGAPPLPIPYPFTVTYGEGDGSTIDLA